MFSSQRYLSLALLPLLVLGAEKRATPSSFQLYAYGDNIGGLPLFNADSYAYVGNPNDSNGTGAAPVTFSPGTGGAWVGQPNTTGLSNTTAPGWSGVTLFVPNTTTTDTRVGFLGSGDAPGNDQSTTGFFFYGNTVMWKDDGTLEAKWSGKQVGSSGVFALHWDDSSSDQIPLTLRSIAPTTNPLTTKK